MESRIFCAVFRRQKYDLVYSKSNAKVNEFSPAIIHKIFETNSFSCKTAHYGKSLISVFQKFFASVNKIFLLAGRLSTRLSFYEV